MPTIITPSVMKRTIVTAPARLHMGFLDLHGGLGRSFGSIGLTISGVATMVAVESAERLTVQGEEAKRVEKIARLLLAHHGETGGLRLTVTEAIPAHVGLGSGTQLALAVGTALARHFQWNLDSRGIARITERGARSGIGIGAFDSGGFLVDGGRIGRVEAPRIVARLPFPSMWRVMLIFDQRSHGIHGDHELAAFEELPEFPAGTSAELCRLTLMQALPALLDRDMAGFGHAIGALQKLVGDYFAPAQGGRFASAAVTEVLEWLEKEGIAGVGQSSWGPTGFAVFASETQAHNLLRAAQARWGESSHLSFTLVSGLNHGGEIQTRPVDNVQRMLQRK